MLNRTLTTQLGACLLGLFISGVAAAGCASTANDAAKKVAEANKMPEMPSLLSNCGIGRLTSLSGLGSSLLSGLSNYLQSGVCGAVNTVVQPGVNLINDGIGEFNSVADGIDGQIDDLNDRVMDDENLPFGSGRVDGSRKEVKEDWVNIYKGIVTGGSGGGK